MDWAAFAVRLQHQNARPMRRIGVALDDLRGMHGNQQFLNKNIVSHQFIVAMRGNAD
jgi:hypothetical protein